jgi:hypothetical protein
MSEIVDHISILDAENNTSRGRSYLTGEVYWYIDRTPDYTMLDIINNAKIDRSTIKKHNIDIIFKNIEISEEEQNCYICMEDREKEVICCLNCNHLICGICAKHMLKTLDTICCPLCRTSITNITVQIKSVQQELSEYCV